jgi:hypothetical protein
MTATDRTFRAMARAQPDVLAAFLRLLSPDVVPDAAALTPLDVLTTGVDAPPPPADADWIAKLMARRRILHAECQGYRDRTFRRRVVRYHASLVLRFPGWKVHTFALWLLRPPPAQRTSTMSYGGITVRVRHFVLRDIPVERMLATTVTACFAPIGDPAGLTPEEVCARTVRALADSGAGWYQWSIAQTMAAVAGWENVMKQAIERLERPDIILIDLVKYGEDKGRKIGRKEGRKEGIALLLRQFERRLGRALTEKERARFDKRLKSLGPERLGDVVLDLAPDALAAWLATPRAR